MTPTLPDIARSDVEAVELRNWEATGAAEQHEIADAVLDEAAQAPWPTGLLSVSCFTTVEPVATVGFLRAALVEDDRRPADRLQVVAYRQWARRPDPSGDGEYRLVTSHLCGDGPPAGCVVMITIDFDGPNARRQRRWIDAVVGAIGAEPGPIPGLLAAHLHASTDGTRVLNYAEWTSLEAYAAALDHGPAGVAQTDLPEWRTVRELPGVRRNTVARCTLHGAVLGPPAVRPEHGR